MLAEVTDGEREFPRPPKQAPRILCKAAHNSALPTPIAVSPSTTPSDLARKTPNVAPCTGFNSPIPSLLDFDFRTRYQTVSFR
jgi:hypothetical protein